MSIVVAAARAAEEERPLQEHRRTRGIARLMRHELFALVASLVGFVLLIGIPHPDFLTWAALVGVARSASLVAVIAFGMVFLLAMREIDLSVGGVYAISLLGTGVLMGHGMNAWWGLVVAPAIGATVSAAIAVIANACRIPVIIVSIGTLSLLTGAGTVLTGGRPLRNLPLDSALFTVFGGDFLNVSVSIWVTLFLVVVLTFVLKRTSFGVAVRAAGSNPEAAESSGISLGRIRLAVMALTGALAGVAGILTLAYYQGSDASVGNTTSLSVIAAVIIGGTAVSGGSGNVVGALIGALIVSVVTSGLVFFDINPNWSAVVTGAVVLVAVSLDGLARRGRRREA